VKWTDPGWGFKPGIDGDPGRKEETVGAHVLGPSRRAAAERGDAGQKFTGLRPGVFH